MAGQCYAISFDRLPSLMQQFGRDKVKLCHGIPTLAKPPFAKYGHAWVEVELAHSVFIVFDPSRDEPVWRQIYYNVGQITYVKRYTPQRALTLSGVLKTEGPWDKTVSAALHAD